MKNLTKYLRPNIVNGGYVFKILLFIVVGLLAGPAQSTTIDCHYFYEVRRFLPPVFGADGSIIRRQLIDIGKTSVVVFLDYPGKPVDSATLYSHLAPLVGNKLRIKTSSIDAKKIGNINCHGYACAISNIPKVPKDAWIHSDFSEVSNYTDSLSVILTNYFNKIFSQKKGMPFSEEVVLKEGDFITFIDSAGQKTHSGVLIRPPNKYSTDGFWIHSKYGQNGEFDVPIEAMEKLYPHVGYEIWRRK